MGECEATLLSWSPGDFGMIFEDEIDGLTDARVTVDRVFGGRDAVGALVFGALFVRKSKKFAPWVLDFALVYMEFGPYIGRHTTLANVIVRSACHRVFADICRDQRKVRVELHAREQARLSAEAESPAEKLAPAPTKAPPKQPVQEGIQIRGFGDVEPAPVASKGGSETAEEETLSSSSSSSESTEEEVEATEDSLVSETASTSISSRSDLEVVDSGDDQENSSSE